MMPLPERREGVIWIDGVWTVPDEKGTEKLVAHYSRRKGLSERSNTASRCSMTSERSLWLRRNCPWRKAGGFLMAIRKSLRNAAGNGSCAVRRRCVVRVPATLKDLLDPTRYEAFTCAAAIKNQKPPAVKMGDDGMPVWRWQSEFPPMNSGIEAGLVKAGKLKSEHTRFYPVNAANTKERIHLHSGTVRWNEHRKRWVLVAGQIGGTASYLGEVWYSEAEHPTGPFGTAVKVVTHNKQSFYNVCHHSFLDRDGGRFIYFEGTYTSDFSGNQDKTPRYNYNQILYRLDLDSAALLTCSDEVENQTASQLPTGTLKRQKNLAPLSQDRLDALR